MARFFISVVGRVAEYSIRKCERLNIFDNYPREYFYYSDDVFDAMSKELTHVESTPARAVKPTVSNEQSISFSHQRNEIRNSTSSLADKGLKFKRLFRSL